MRALQAIASAAGVLALLAVAGAGALLARDRGDDLRRSPGAPAPPPDPAAAARGAYLAQVGHCSGCHTARGGAAMAGGRAIATPFGTVHSANLTPDDATGIGRWTDAAFRRALREGRSADGRALLPVCPYPNFSLVGAADADDLHAWLRSLAPQRVAVPPHALRFPYGTRLALAAWRARHFRVGGLPQGLAPVQRRGAYLVGGLGHCSACHGRRDGWGATAGAWDFRGGTIPQQGWLAPSLTDPRAAGVTGWTEAETVALLRDGRHARAGALGPMALVVAGSTRHWRDDDLRAAAAFLRQLPPSPAPPSRPAHAPDAALLQQGAQLYERHCADCHGPDGEGVADDGPALAGNRALALEPPVNLIRVVLEGGFGPSTAAVPRPPGMPPFATLLSDEAIAAVVSHLRWRHGAGAAPVSALEVNRERGGELR